MAQIFNQAQLSYNSTVINSNITVGELLPSLTVTKTAVGTTYTRGSEVTYIISLVNRSDSPCSAVVITDDLGGYDIGTETVYPLAYVDGSVLLFTNGTLGTAPAVNAEVPLSFSEITVPANGNVMIIYQAEITEFAPLGIGDEIVNTVTVDAPCIGGSQPPVSDSETITAEEAPSIAITKHMEPTTVIDNDIVTYTFVIENYGNTALTEEDGSVLTDTFTPPLSDITVTFNGEPWTESVNYTYAEASGAFATLPGQITVPAATFSQDPVTGVVTVIPGSVTLTVSGTI